MSVLRILAQQCTEVSTSTQTDFLLAEIREHSAAVSGVAADSVGQEEEFFVTDYDGALVARKWSRSNEKRQ